MLGKMRRQKYLPHAKCSNPAGSSSVLPLRLSEHRAIGRQATDARDGEIAGQPSRVLQARAHPGRYRKQEFVIFPSTEGIAQRRALLDGQCVDLDDRAKAAGLADLPDPVGKAITEIDARARRAIAAEHQAEACPRLRPQVPHDAAVGSRLVASSRRSGEAAAADSMRKPAAAPPSVPVT